MCNDLRFLPIWVIVRTSLTLVEKEHTFMSETEQEGREEQLSEILNFPIEWHVSDTLPSHYAANVFVQPGQYEVILTFFEMRPPLLTGTPEQNKATLEKLGAVRAECVSRIIIDPDLIPKLIEALQKGLEGYHASRAIQQGGIES